MEGALRPGVSRVIADAAEREELLLSPITAWEIGMLANRGRIRLDEPAHTYVRDLFVQRGLVVAPITPAIAVAAGELPRTFHGDPADRILIATAAAYGAQLVTRDKAIHEYAKGSKAIRCLAC